MKGGWSCVSVCTCDDCVAFVVEGAAEDLVRVALEHLQAVAGLDLPESRYLVATGCEHLGALRVEADLEISASWPIKMAWQAPVMVL